MNYYTIDDERSFVKQIQKMLRSLSVWTNDAELSVPESGVLDEITARAIEHFQIISSLPPTGTICIGTWNELYKRYSDTKAAHDKAMPIYPFASRDGFKVQIGERSDLVLLIQLMLNELRIHYNTYGYIPPNGKFNLSTASAVREFQKINLLPINGIVDRSTWNSMARQYNDLMDKSNQ